MQEEFYVIAVIQWWIYPYEMWATLRNLQHHTYNQKFIPCKYKLLLFPATWCSGITGSFSGRCKNWIGDYMVRGSSELCGGVDFFEFLRPPVQGGMAKKSRTVEIKK